MFILKKRFIGQPLTAWIFQIALIYLAWKVKEGVIPNNLWTIIFAGVLIMLIYLSFALFDRKK